MLKTKRSITGKVKTCSKCKLPCDTSLFNYHPDSADGLDSWCRPCKALRAKAYYWKDADRHREAAKLRSRSMKHATFQRKVDNPSRYLHILAKSRAKKNGVYFNLLPEDIVIPTHCPALGIKLELSHGKYATNASPTLDRFIPELGYIPGNVTVISKKANRLKGDGTLQELECLVTWMKGLK